MSIATALSKEDARSAPELGDLPTRVDIVEHGLYESALEVRARRQHTDFEDSTAHRPDDVPHGLVFRLERVEGSTAHDPNRSGFVEVASIQ